MTSLHPEVNKLAVMALQSMGYNPTIGESGLLVPIDLGIQLESRGIAYAIESDMDFIQEISGFLHKQKIGDFSEMEYEEDKVLNKEAFLTQKGRILNSFNSSKGKVWVITEFGTSPECTSTTILFPEEY